MTFADFAFIIVILPIWSVPMILVFVVLWAVMLAGVGRARIGLRRMQNGGTK